jgi:hypothetical protein
MGRAYSTNGREANAYRILVGKTEGKRSLGRPRRRWGDNIKMTTGPEVDSASNRNEYQESLKIKKPGDKVRPARRADNFAAIY